MTIFLLFFYQCLELNIALSFIIPHLIIAYIAIQITQKKQHKRINNNVMHVTLFDWVYSNSCYKTGQYYSRYLVAVCYDQYNGLKILSQERVSIFN